MIDVKYGAGRFLSEDRFHSYPGLYVLGRDALQNMDQGSIRHLLRSQLSVRAGRMSMKASLGQHHSNRFSSDPQPNAILILNLEFLSFFQSAIT
jgi:hypothetical protein